MKRMKRLKESVYEIIYDYTSEEGYEETNNVEEFEGTWSDLQDYIKQMRLNGCYNIVANEIYEECAKLKEADYSETDEFTLIKEMNHWIKQLKRYFVDDSKAQKAVADYFYYDDGAHQEDFKELQSSVKTLRKLWLKLNAITEEAEEKEYKEKKYDESLKEDFEETEIIDLSDYKFISSPDPHYHVYRKVIKDENGLPRGIWAAVAVDGKTSKEVGEPFRITYDQALGYDPIGGPNLGKMIGKALKMRRESVEESYSINEELSLDDKKFREAVRFCDNTVEDLADELWRRYIELDDAIDCIKRFCERGKGRRSLLANIQSHIDAGDLENVIEDVYFRKDDEMNSMKSRFGRV